jgi:hypothetical protein
VVKPKEDGCCGHRPSCLGGAFVKKALAMSGFLTFVCGTLVEKMLATSSLVLLMSGFLVKKALTTCSLLAGSLLAFIGSTRQGGIGGERPPVLCKKLACQDGIGGLPSGGDGARSPTGCRLPTSNPGSHVLRGCKSHVEWAPQAIPEAAAWQHVGLCKVLVGAILLCEGDNQCRPGDCSVDNS